MPGTNATEGINSVNNISRSLSSIDFLDRDKTTRNEVEQLGDNIKNLSTTLGGLIPGAGPIVSLIGTVIGIIGGVSG